MKLRLNKHLGCQIYKWHSINLIPSFALLSIVDDDKIKSTNCKIDDAMAASYFEMVIFGIVFGFMVPNKNAKKQFIGKVRGPLWSRRRRCWYLVKE